MRDNILAKSYFFLFWVDIFIKASNSFKAKCHGRDEEMYNKNPILNVAYKVVS